MAADDDAHGADYGQMVAVGAVDKVELMAEKIRAVEIRAEVRQIKTMADGTINLVLNLPEDCKEQVKVMLDWQQMEVLGVLEVMMPEEVGYGL